LFLLSIFGAIFFFENRLVIIFFVIAVLTLFPIISPSITSNVLTSISRYFPFSEKLQEIISAFHFLYDKRISGVSLVVTLVSYLVAFLQGYFLIIALGGEIDLKVVILVFPIIILTNVLPFTIGGLGVREGTSVVLLSMFSISKEIAINFAFLWFIVNTFIPGAIGVLMTWKIKR
jgi:uncharacterized protein (TIRG00374 family)